MKKMDIFVLWYFNFDGDKRQQQFRGGFQLQCFFVTLWELVGFCGGVGVGLSGRLFVGDFCYWELKGGNQGIDPNDLSFLDQVLNNMTFK